MGWTERRRSAPKPSEADCGRVVGTRSVLPHLRRRAASVLTRGRAGHWDSFPPRRAERECARCLEAAQVQLLPAVPDVALPSACRGAAPPSQGAAPAAAARPRRAVSAVTGHLLTSPFVAGHAAVLGGARLGPAPLSAGGRARGGGCGDRSRRGRAAGGGAAACSFFRRLGRRCIRLADEVSGVGRCQRGAGWER